MSHGDEDERRAEETKGDGAPVEEPQAHQTAGEDDQRDAQVAEIEQDPSRNPPNELLRDIKGG